MKHMEHMELNSKNAPCFVVAPKEHLLREEHNFDKMVWSGMEHWSRVWK